mmetsp:Transcript_4867/g.8812  ORF Transcript_4867/g.8812 Transcript_4867/m.8812 type:complete len:332 (-) Transcript_4867:86-1081(-)
MGFRAWSAISCLYVLLNQLENGHAIKGRTGETVQIVDYDFMVSLNWKTYHRCAGTVVSPYWILTTASCAKKRSRYINRVISMQNDVSRRHKASPLKRSRTLQKGNIYLHPDYNAKLGTSDFAMLKLDKPLNKVTPIALATADDSELFKAQEELTYVNWVNNKKRMIKATTPVVARAVCEAKDIMVDVDTSRCIGPIGTETPAICFKETGGPLIARKDDAPLLIGLVSWRHERKCGTHALMKLTSAEIEWITNHMNNVPPTVPPPTSAPIATPAPTPQPTPLSREGWTEIQSNCKSAHSDMESCNADEDCKWNDKAPSQKCRLDKSVHGPRP